MPATASTEPDNRIKVFPTCTISLLFRLIEGRNPKTLDPFAAAPILMRIYRDFCLSITKPCAYPHVAVIQKQTSGAVMPVIQLTSRTSKGQSFAVPELILIRSWSEANGLRMVVRLDHGSEAEDYEEVLAFHQGDSPLCCWIMWRNSRSVFIQPLIGRIQRYGSVAEAFEAMAAKRRVVVTDIDATHWPT